MEKLIITVEELAAIQKAEQYQFEGGLDTLKAFVDNGTIKQLQVKIPYSKNMDLPLFYFDTTEIDTRIKEGSIADSILKQKSQEFLESLDQYEVAKVFGLIPENDTCTEECDNECEDCEDYDLDDEYDDDLEGYDDEDWDEKDTDYYYEDDDEDEEFMRDEPDLPQCLATMDIKPHTTYDRPGGYYLDLSEGYIDTNAVKNAVREATGCCLARDSYFTWERITDNTVVVKQFTTGRRSY